MKKFFRNIFVSATIIFQVIGLILVFIFGAQISSAIHPQPKPEWVFYRVEEGDSIFAIAQNVCDPEDRKDPRAIVEEIKQKNKKKESKEIDETEIWIIYKD